MLLIDFCWTFSRCAVQWQDYQKAREEVIELMNDAEKKLSEFSLLKTSSSHEAEEKLSEHKVSSQLFSMPFHCNCNGSLYYDSSRIRSINLHFYLGSLNIRRIRITMFHSKFNLIKLSFLNFIFRISVGNV